MLDAVTMPMPIIPLPASLELSCDGDFCRIPEHHTQAVINRKLDENAV